MLSSHRSGQVAICTTLCQDPFEAGSHLTQPSCSTEEQEAMRRTLQDRLPVDNINCPIFTNPLVEKRSQDLFPPILKTIFPSGLPTLPDWLYCNSSFSSDAQPLHTSMPIAWIPGCYGNSMAPTQISVLSSLWSPWSPILMGAGVLSKATFFFCFSRKRWIDERGRRSQEAERQTQSQIKMRESPKTLIAAAVC